MEDEVGLTFPSDYREWLTRYTEVQLDGFLYIIHPGGRPEKSALTQAREMLDPLVFVTEDLDPIWLVGDQGGGAEVNPFPVYPNPGGLYPWGVTDNGDTCLWLTDQDPEKWTVVITDGADWWQFKGSFSDFLVGLLKGLAVCPIFPRRFPGSAHIEEISEEDLNSRAECDL
ncbi:SMI1/KNR4 family protein [Microtetraspora glauca]|uniref:SMI1/KNR4 family protein n=1 Tax=Microtetraspora glauca TaxID=1996 RepID=A0ABV3GU65_MICGL